LIGPQIQPGQSIRSNTQQLKPSSNEVGYQLVGTVLQRLNALLKTPEGKQYQLQNQVNNFVADRNISIVATRVSSGNGTNYTVGEVVLPFSPQHAAMVAQNSTVGTPKVVNPTYPGGRKSRVLVGGPEYRRLLKAYLNGVGWANSNVDPKMAVLNLIKAGYQVGLGPQLQADGLELVGAENGDWTSAVSFTANNPSSGNNWFLRNVKRTFNQFTPQFRVASGAKGFKALVTQHPDIFQVNSATLKNLQNNVTQPLPRQTEVVVDSRGRARARQSTGIRRTPEASYPTDYWNLWGTNQSSVWGVADEIGNRANPQNAEEQYAEGFGCSPLNSGPGVSNEFHLYPTRRSHRSGAVTTRRSFGRQTPPYGASLPGTARQYASVDPATCRPTPNQRINPANNPLLAEIIQAGGQDPQVWAQQAQENDQQATRGRRSGLFTGQGFGEDLVVTPGNLRAARTAGQARNSLLARAQAQNFPLRQQVSRSFGQ